MEANTRTGVSDINKLIGESRVGLTICVTVGAALSHVELFSDMFFIRIAIGLLHTAWILFSLPEFPTWWNENMRPYSHYVTRGEQRVMVWKARLPYTLIIGATVLGVTVISCISLVLFYHIAAMAHIVFASLMSELRTAAKDTNTKHE